MNTRNRLIGFLFVAGVMIQNYLAQVSHVPAAEIAKWTAHDWTGAILFIVGSGLTAWKAVLHNPSALPVNPAARGVLGTNTGPAAAGNGALEVKP